MFRKLFAEDSAVDNPSSVTLSTELWLIQRNRFGKLMMTLVIFNLAIRTLIYLNTQLFAFGDFSAYLGGVVRLLDGDSLYMVEGNFILTISWLGYMSVRLFGSLHGFFILNIVSGAASSFLISILWYRISGSRVVALICMVSLTLYTEFMVFSSIFYTPVLMILLLTLLMWSLWYYYLPGGVIRWKWLLTATAIVMLSFSLKPELLFLPPFLAVIAVVFRKERVFLLRTVTLAAFLAGSSLLFYGLQLLPSEPGHTISNSFIFFGHTDYGGDGGEGSFVYPENEERYRERFSEFCRENSIVKPERRHYNEFHWQEIRRFVTGHPGQWVLLQLKKFTRTFGVVPEGNSFKVLYTGIGREKVWLISILTVVPVVTFLFIFLLLFSKERIKQVVPEHSYRRIFVLLLVYYIVATVFFGHYQERYRMPVMVCFIIPLVSSFMMSVSFQRHDWSIRSWLRIAVLTLFFTVWSQQAITALGNEERLRNALDQAMDDSY